MGNLRLAVAPGDGVAFLRGGGGGGEVAEAVSRTVGATGGLTRWGTGEVHLAMGLVLQLLFLGSCSLFGGWRVPRGVGEVEGFA